MSGLVCIHGEYKTRCGMCAEVRVEDGDWAYFDDGTVRGHADGRDE